MIKDFLAHRGLMAAGVAAAMAEAGVLAVTAPGALPLAPQVSALAPLAVFHDLRWLYSDPRPWPGFLAMLVGLIVVRAALTALMFRLAWPSGSRPLSLRAAMRPALGLVIALCVLISPVVSLSVGVAILPFSWPYLASLPVLLAIAATLSHGGMLSTWWRRLPPLATVGWLLADFAALSVAGAFMARLPAAAAVGVAGLAGLMNALAWFGVAHAVVRRLAFTAPAGAVAAPQPVHGWPVALAGTATVIAMVIAVTRVAFWVTTPPHSTRPAPPPHGARAYVPGRSGAGDQAGVQGPAHRRLAVLVVPGFGSFCCARTQSLARAMPDARVRQFSYRGLDAAGRPLPYTPQASNLPLPVLGDRIASQVAKLHAMTRRPVDIVAESEGTLGVEAMLARHPHVPIGSVALLSPIVAPGHEGYAEQVQPDAVPRVELGAVVWFIGGLSPYGTSGAQTLIDSVDRLGARYAAQAQRNHPARTLSVVPLADTVTLPVCTLPASVHVVPAFHGVLLGDLAALRMVRDFLNGRPVHDAFRLRGTAELIAAAASPWRMPEADPPSPPCAR